MGSIVAELAEKISSATNNFSVDAQVLYVDTVNDEVGVNTTTPDGAFSIHQSGTDDIFNLYDGTDNITTVVDGGGLTHKGTLTVGVDDTGHDVKFFGDTASRYWLWDTSADGVVQQGTLTIGVNDTGHDVKFFGATAGAYLEWDESADELEIRGGAATPGKLLLSTAETTVVDGNEIGRINFQAPLDSAGTDAILVGASIHAEADATFSSSVNSTDLVFSTGDSETAVERMRINSTGNIGIGETSSSYKLSVIGDIYSSVSIGVGTNPSGTAGEIRATNNVTAYYSSDIALKENISPIGNALDKLSQISGVEFDWTKDYIDDHGGEDGYFVRKHDVGVIAQEIKKVLPEVVAERQDGTLAVRYEKIIALLIEAVKELKGKLGEK